MSLSRKKLTFISLELSKFKNLPIQSILNSYLFFVEIHPTEFGLSYVSHFIMINSIETLVKRSIFYEIKETLFRVGSLRSKILRPNLFWPLRQKKLKGGIKAKWLFGQLRIQPLGYYWP